MCLFASACFAILKYYCVTLVYMTKNVLIGIATFGGLLLISVILKDTNEVPETADTDVVESTVAIPGYASGQFPIYPDGTLERVTESEGDSSKDVSLTISAEASLTEVNQWYREALGTGAWGIKSDKNVAGYQIIQGENSNLYTSMQAAGSEEEGWVIITQHLKIRK